mgnify:CR=1 FL=1
MQEISGTHSCPSCEKEASFTRVPLPATPQNMPWLGHLFLTRPGKAVVAALSDKNAYSYRCDNCLAVVAACPYCGALNVIRAHYADCTKCRNMFIVHP